MIIDFAEDIANQLFVLGFVCNKLKDVPIAPLSNLFAAACMSCFLAAYSIQIYSSSYYYSEDENSHYAFLYQLYACIGATTCLGFIFFPNQWLLCLYLFFLNNCLWYLAEMDRLEHPCMFPKSSPHPQAYLAYVEYICWSFAATTLAYTLAAFFQAMGPQIIFCGLIVNYLCTIQALIYLNAQPDAPEQPLEAADQKNQIPFLIV